MTASRVETTPSTNTATSSVTAPSSGQSTPAPPSAMRKQLRGMSFADGERAMQVTPATGLGGAGADKRNTTGIAAFEEALASKVGDAKCQAAWGDVADKTAVPVTTVVQAILKLGAALGHTVLDESGKGFTVDIVNAIKTRDKAWRDVLVADHLEAISSCADDAPLAGLRPIVKASGRDSTVNRSLANLKPKLSEKLASGDGLLAQQPNTITLEETGFAAYRKASFNLGDPGFSWEVSFRGPDGIRWPIQPEGAADQAKASFVVQPSAVGKASIDARVSIFSTSKMYAGVEGYLGQAKQAYDVTVLDPKDTVGFFEARFNSAFADIVDSDAFKDPKYRNRGAIAELFNADQQRDLLDYIASKRIPTGLFTDHADNKTNASQRILISGSVLMNGKLHTPEQKEVDGRTWIAGSCGGWAQGVLAYAAVSGKRGYGSNNGERALTPTGRTAYGTGKDAVRNAGKSTNPEADGRTKSGPGKKCLRLSAYEDTLKPGDWLFLDNGIPQGHSVIFVRWLDGKKPDATSRRAQCFQQARYGVAATSAEFTFGWPSGEGVDGVTDITHPEEDAQIAATIEGMLAFDEGNAVQKNKPILDKQPDLFAFKTHLHGRVAQEVAKIGGKYRQADSLKNPVKASFSKPQALAVQSFMALAASDRGPSGNESDIAKLVALGQLMNIIFDNAGNEHPDGCLTSKTINMNLLHAAKTSAESDKVRARPRWDPMGN